MGWLRIELTEAEQGIVQSERETHADVVVRRRLWVLWRRHCGLKREQAAKVVGLAVSSVQRDVSLSRDGGLAALRTSERESPPTSELAEHREQIRQSLEQRPARTIAEACQRIKDLTGIERANSRSAVLEEPGTEVANGPCGPGASEKHRRQHREAVRYSSACRVPVN